MMPTRLQDGLTLSLLQWMHSADPNETRRVLIRMSDTDDMGRFVASLKEAGVWDIQVVSPTSLTGNVTPPVLAQATHCLGGCSIAPAAPEPE